jgi:DNA polymerase/3'-5' exonuclease PolX
MRQMIIPWLATLLFGFGVFVVGKILQASEKQKRAERRAAKERADNLAVAIAQAQELLRDEPAGIMAAAAGQGQRSRRTIH